MAVVEEPKGCLVRIWHGDRNVLALIERWFEGDFQQEVIDTFQIAQHPGAPEAEPTMIDKRWCLRQKRMGNLTLTGWMAHITPEFEELDAESMLAYQRSLTIGFELVY